MWLWYFNGLVFIPGGYSRYYCGSSFINTANVQWLINGTQFEDLNLIHVGIFQNIRQGTLYLNYILSYYNNSTIQCRVTFNNGETADSSSVTMLVQGEREL